MVNQATNEMRPAEGHVGSYDNDVQPVMDVNNHETENVKYGNDEDLVEVEVTWGLGKSLGLQFDNEEKVLKELAKDKEEMQRGEYREEKG